MFNLLRKKLILALGKNKDLQVSHKQYEHGEGSGGTEQRPISSSLQENKQVLLEIFNNCSDLKYREFELGTAPPVNLMAVYIDGLVSISELHSSILSTLMLMEGQMEEVSAYRTLELIKNKLVPIGEVQEDNNFVSIVDKILSGYVALFVEGQEKAVLLSAKGWENRSLSEPLSEPVVRGPREGFTENFITNIMLLRRRIKTSRLKVETMQIGLLTKTRVGVVYVEELANNKVVEEVKKRLGRIKIDGILESGYIEEFIQDEWKTPFQQILSTERPDKAAGHLMEGHVVIVVDTTPFALILPITFFHFLFTAEDYYGSFQGNTFIRIFRLLAVNIALLAPSVYIAVVTFHQEMIPTPLMLNIARAREGVPFPAFVEAFLMEATFELLREAGVRMPRPVGQAISIVGALVIGEAAVTAGLISPAMVIVVASTAIASFAIPNYLGAIALRILRFPIMVLAASLGLFGIMVGLMGLLIHLCSLRSFGVPYISPIAPLVKSDMKDFILRAPWWAMFTRPRLIGYKEPQRQENKKMPEPPRRRPK